MCYLFEKYKPEVMSMEKLFYNNNAKTVIDVAQARGVITLSAQNYGVDIFEYTPLQVKQAVVGYGRAEKKQVQEMTRLMLGLAKIPKPDDTADALAMAICHGHCLSTLRLHLRASKNTIMMSISFLPFSRLKWNLWARVVFLFV